ESLDEALSDLTENSLIEPEILAADNAMEASDSMENEIESSFETSEDVEPIDGFDDADEKTDSLDQLDSNEGDDFDPFDEMDD
ncbi:MAG: hypothetical protein AAF203_08310, partial [Pseudomonadota bacterium]